MPTRGEIARQIDGIYATYKGRIFNLAYRMTGNQEAAEDIVQET